MTARSPERPPGEWRSIALGTRVVVRSRLPEGEGYLFTDAIGELTSIDPVVVETRHGTVTIDPATVVVVKPVPPAPARRGPRS